MIVRNPASACTSWALSCAAARSASTDAPRCPRSPACSSSRPWSWARIARDMMFSPASTSSARSTAPESAEYTSLWSLHSFFSRPRIAASELPTRRRLAWSIAPLGPMICFLISAACRSSTSECASTPEEMVASAPAIIPSTISPTRRARRRNSRSENPWSPPGVLYFSRSFPRRLSRSSCPVSRFLCAACSASPWLVMRPSSSRKCWRCACSAMNSFTKISTLPCAASM
mmetsp:Transcript_31862/g.75707  ORF Transcript_31862/g.75707 Transcript_31862/m.75707 type:complete len:230 (+) Transcript_31862:925-1614(+)